MTRRHPRRPAGLAIPAGAVNGFGTSADFYDSVGVNVHWKPNGAYGNPTTMVQDLANLGVRHARDTMTGSWWSTVYLYYRAANVVVRNRNASLPAVSSTDRGQPLFLSIHTPGWTGNQPQGFGNDFSFTVDDWYDMWEAGRAHWQPQLSPRTQIADGTTSNPDAAVPNPWAWADPELDWSIVGQMTSANEPNNTAIGNLKAWTKELNDKLKPRKSTVAFGGLPVVTVNGIQSHCSVSQIPMVGPSVINNGTAQSAGDMSQNTGVCDLGDQHPYHVGHEPSQEKVTKDLTQTGLCFNGQLASPPSSANSLPFVFTEWGQITRGVGNIAYPGAHDGYWPAPDDVIAEYAVRAFVLFYLRGVRRTFFYELYDTLNESTNPENNFGLLTNSRTKKAQFYAIRNLLRIVGFSEPVGTSKRKLAISVAGFSAKGSFYDSGSNSIVQTSSGKNQHYAMYTGQGDSGSVSTGGVYHENADRLDTLQLQQSNNTWLLFIMRQVMLWDREVGNWNTGTNQPQSMGNVTGGRYTPDSQSLTVTLPAEVTACSVAQPTAGGTSTPDDGFAFTNLTITSNQVTVPIQGNLKVLKIVV
jgi:hypothetical protein